MKSPIVPTAGTGADAHPTAGPTQLAVDAFRHPFGEKVTAAVQQDLPDEDGTFWAHVEDNPQALAATILMEMLMSEPSRAAVLGHMLFLLHMPLIHLHAALSAGGPHHT